VHFGNIYGDANLKRAMARGLNGTRAMIDHNDLPLVVLSLPASVSGEEDGGWGVFALAKGDRFQVGYISPDPAGTFHVAVCVPSEVVTAGVGIAVCDYSADFANFDDAISAIRTFLSRRRIRP